METYNFRNADYVEFDLSPDGHAAVVLEAHGKNGGRLVAVDVATGEKRADLTPPMSRYERASYLWTKDGRHLVVRHRGAPLQADGYTRYETRLTLFSLPGFEQIAEWQSKAPGCWRPDVSGTNMAQDDGGTLVVRCSGSSAPAGNGSLAVLISLPSLNEVGIRNRTDYGAGGSADWLVALGGAVYAPIREQGDDPGVVLANVVHPEHAVALDAPFAADRGGSLTFQDFVTFEDAGDTIGMRFCGATEAVSNPPRIATQTPWGPSFCRTVRFSIVDGSYIGLADNAETRISRPSVGPRDFSVASGKWQFTGTIDPASLTGELQVRDAASGTILQTVQSSAQRPLIATEAPDRLFTHRVNERTIAVYEIFE